MKKGLVVGCYPQDRGWNGGIPIPEPVVVCWMQELYGDIFESEDFDRECWEKYQRLNYINKGYTIVNTDYYSKAVAVYLHDGTWYLIDKPHSKLTREEKEQAEALQERKWKNETGTHNTDDPGPDAPSGS